ncbi:MAG: hypothetical protein AUJ54_12260 [Ignavibacteria bacterium CG1_02_37_35]|nr:MAG: hypothetical protein AUJ54_12260 [Ignavibacteria bacterium CG1_02_37_35]
MNEMKKTAGFSDYIYILYKWKKFLFINLFLIGLITTGITFLIPKTYKSTAVVMIPPESTFGMGGLTSLLGGGKSTASSIGSKLLGTSSASEDVLFGLLNSRTALMNVIQNFGLLKYYKVEDQNYDKVIKAFVNDLSFEKTENDFIEINVVNESAQKSADIANYFISMLDSLNIKINSEAARNNRIFIEKRYFKNLEDLKKAEDSLYLFQKKYGIAAIPQQFEIAFKAAAEIEAILFQKEISAEFIRQQYGENSPQYQGAQSEILMLRKKVSELKSSEKIMNESNILFPFKDIPDISVNYLRVYREIEIQSKIMEFVLPMYEQSKVEELKSIPTIIFIDKAVPAQIKYRPQRMFIVLAFFFLSLFVFLPMVFRMESLTSKNSFKNPLEEAEFKYYMVIKRYYRIFN